MKKTLLALTALGALAATAAPAAAQHYGHDRDRDRAYDRHERNWDGGDRARVADRRIERGLRNGSLTPHEARVLRGEVWEFTRLERQLARGGLQWNEQRQLDLRFERLMNKISNAASNRYYSYGYGYGEHR